MSVSISKITNTIIKITTESTIHYTPLNDVEFIRKNDSTYSIRYNNTIHDITYESFDTSIQNRFGNITSIIEYINLSKIASNYKSDIYLYTVGNNTTSGNNTYFSNNSKNIFGSNIGIFKIDNDGTVIEKNENALFDTAATINDIIEDVNSNIYIGGNFTKVNNNKYKRIVKLDSMGDIDTSFTPNGGFNANVSSLTQDDNYIYAGGSFTSYYSDEISKIAILNIDGTLNTDSIINDGLFDDDVYCYAYDNISDFYYLGGNFTLFNQSSYNRIISLNIDGSINNNFIINSGFNSTVNAIELDINGNLYVGGAFTLYNNTTYNRIIKLSATGSVISNFNIGTGFNNTVNTVCYDSINDKVYIGGAFTSYNGTTVNRIIRLNTDGTIDNTFNIGSGFNNIVNTIYYDSNINKVYIGGAFTSYNGTTSNRIIRLNTDGTIDNTFNIGSGFNSGNVFKIKVLDGYIYVGGSFTSYKSISRIASISATSGSPLNDFTNVSGFDSTVNTISYDYNLDKIICGGAFATYNGVTYNRIASLNTDGTPYNQFNIGSGFNNTVNNVIAMSNSNIMCVGAFTAYNGNSTNRVVMLSPTGSISNSFSVGTGFNNTVNTTYYDNINNLFYFGGNFTTYKGSTYNRIIRVSATGSIDTSFNTSTTFTSNIKSIYYDNQNNNIYVGGAFTTGGRIVKLNYNGTRDTTFNSGGAEFNSTVNTITLANNKLYIGGAFTSYNSIGYNRIISLNLDGTVNGTFSIGTGFNGVVNNITLDAVSNKLYVVGVFSSYNGYTCNGLIRLNLDGSVDNTFLIKAGFNSTTSGLSLNNLTNKLYVVGSFTSYYNNSPIVKINNDGNTDNNFALQYYKATTNTVYDFTLYDSSNLIISGKYTTNDDKNNIIKINPLNGATYSNFPIGNSFDNTVFSTFKLKNNSLVNIGSFLTYNAMVYNRIVSILKTNASINTNFNIGTGFDSIVNKIIYVKEVDKLYVVGQFTSYNSTPSNFIISLNTDGTINTSFNIGSGFNTSATDISYSSEYNVLYVRGLFTTYNGTSVKRLMSLNMDGTINTNFNLDNTNVPTPIKAIPYKDNVYVLTSTSLSIVTNTGQFINTLDISDTSSTTNFNIIDEYIYVSITINGLNYILICDLDLNILYTKLSKNSIRAISYTNNIYVGGSETYDAYGVGQGYAFNNINDDFNAISTTLNLNYTDTFSYRNTSIIGNTISYFYNNSDKNISMFNNFTSDIIEFGFLNSYSPIAIFGEIDTNNNFMLNNNIANAQSSVYKFNNTVKSFTSSFTLNTQYKTGSYSSATYLSNNIYVSNIGYNSQTYSILKFNSNTGTSQSFISSTISNSDILNITSYDSKLYVSKFNTSTYDGIIYKLNTDGTIDNTFNNISYSLNASVLVDGKPFTTFKILNNKLFVGGLFKIFSSELPYQGLVCFDLNGNYYNAFNVNGGFNSSVYKVRQTSDNNIIVIGNFSTYNNIDVSDKILILNMYGDIVQNTPPIYRNGIITDAYELKKIV